MKKFVSTVWLVCLVLIAGPESVTGRPSLLSLTVFNRSGDSEPKDWSALAVMVAILIVATVMHGMIDSYRKRHHITPAKSSWPTPLKPFFE